MCTKVLQLAIDIFLKFLLEIVDLLEIVALLSGIQLGDSVTYIHISILFQILNPYRLLQNIIYCWVEFPVLYSGFLLIILYIVVCRW